MGFKEIGLIILVLLVFTSAITSIFYFVGISFSSYGNYLMWVWVLVIFFLSLPTEQKSDLLKY